MFQSPMAKLIKSVREQQQILWLPFSLSETQKTTKKKNLYLHIFIKVVSSVHPLRFSVRTKKEDFSGKVFPNSFLL